MKSSLFPFFIVPAVSIESRCRLSVGAKLPAFRYGALKLAIAASLFLPLATPAFPPAPHHTIYGTVRDEYGTPLMTSQAQVVLVTPTGVQIATTIVPGLAPGVNYRLDVPMDAGATADPYEPTALMTAAQYKMLVVVGQTTNLPIQMTGSFSLLGRPAQQTRIDLTLGQDSNGDGIPDAWELAYLAALGSNVSLASLSAGRVLGPSGLTIGQEFIAGYYPYDPADTLTLQILEVNGGPPLLQFTAITGRSYWILGSSDLRAWTPLSFQVPAEGSNALAHSYYFASDVRTVQVEPTQPVGASPPTLGFARQGNQVVLSWPTNATGFTLVSAATLSTTVWTPVASAPLIVGGKYLVADGLKAPEQFYKLSSTPVHFFKLQVQ
jgi:hypothetical protein